MKGIIATNDPHLVESLRAMFPDWFVVVAQTKVLIEYYPLPPQK